MKYIMAIFISFVLIVETQLNATVSASDESLQKCDEMALAAANEASGAAKIALKDVNLVLDLSDKGDLNNRGADLKLALVKSERALNVAQFKIDMAYRLATGPSKDSAARSLYESENARAANRLAMQRINSTIMTDLKEDATPAKNLLADVQVALKSLESSAQRSVLAMEETIIKAKAENY